MTTEDPRIEKVRQIIAEFGRATDAGANFAMTACKAFTEIDALLSRPVEPVASSSAHELPFDHPARRGEGRRHTPSLAVWVKCDHCDNEATHADDCPYQADVHDDPTLFHFWCDSPECAAIVEADQHESAMDI